MKKDNKTNFIKKKRRTKLWQNGYVQYAVTFMKESSHLRNVTPPASYKLSTVSSTSITQSPIVRVALSKLIPTFTMRLPSLR